MTIGGIISKCYSLHVAASLLSHLEWSKHVRTASCLGPFLVRYVTAGYEIQSEAELCMDHSGGHEIQSEAVFSAIDLVPFFDLSRFVLLNFDEPVLFSFCPAKEICERVFCCFRCYVWN